MADQRWRLTDGETHQTGTPEPDLVIRLMTAVRCSATWCYARRRWRPRQRPGQPAEPAELFSEVVSTPTVWRILAEELPVPGVAGPVPSRLEELPVDPCGISGLWSVLARVRECAWALILRMPSVGCVVREAWRAPGLDRRGHGSRSSPVGPRTSLGRSRVLVRRCRRTPRDRVVEACRCRM